MRVLGLRLLDGRRFSSGVPQSGTCVQLRPQSLLPGSQKLLPPDGRHPVHLWVQEEFCHCLWDGSALLASLWCL